MKHSGAGWGRRCRRRRPAWRGGAAVVALGSRRRRRSPRRGGPTGGAGRTRGALLLARPAPTAATSSATGCRRSCAGTATGCSCSRWTPPPEPGSGPVRRRRASVRGADGRARRAGGRHRRPVHRRRPRTSAIEFPALVATSTCARAASGWPDLPGLHRLASAAGSVVTSSPGRLLAATERRPDGILDRLARDRWGNTAALVLLAGMVAGRSASCCSGSSAGAAVQQAAPADAAGSRGRTAATAAPHRRRPRRVRLPLLRGRDRLERALRPARARATWCSTAAYAQLLGVPVAYIGLAGYVLIGAAFLVELLARGRRGPRAAAGAVRA